MIIHQSLHGWNGRPTLSYLRPDGHLIRLEYGRRHDIRAYIGLTQMPVPRSCTTLEEAAEAIASSPYDDMKASLRKMTHGQKD